MKRLLLVASALIVILAPVHAQDLPDGPGKSVLENTCGACHGPDIVVGQNGSRDYWQDIVDSMRGRGAAGTEDDFKVIVDYLTRFLGVPVNVNTAAAKGLVTDLVITPEEADAIVKYRTDNGKFKDWSDLTKVPGLDIKKLEPIKNRIKF
jgi:competence protein ComEA